MVQIKEIWQVFFLNAIGIMNEGKYSPSPHFIRGIE